ncbi:hypothetical protein HYU50_02760 [Candidatus Woesearchaeota archaeon]|nr:hypothetical protein [Candidatus Woesearchaeota archaeon]
MVKPKDKITITVLSILLLITIALSAYSYIGLKKDLNNLKSSSKQLEENFKVLKNNYELLKKENSKLKEENIGVKEESVSISQKMKEVETSMDQTMDKLNDFENTVQDSINWFKQNINLENLDIYDGMKEELKGCMKAKDTCEIDLSCINEVNAKNKFKYYLDEISTGKSDFLKNLSLIYDDKGGDCEDFSLLFRAEYNYLVGECLVNYTREEITPTTEEKEIEGTYMYIICGSFDPGKIVQDYAGHCLVALAENPINKSSDIYQSLKSSTLVEPQNGQFVAEMADTDIIRLFDDGMVPNTYYRVWMVIVDDDLKIFYERAEDIKWMGYFDFLEETKPLREKVEK